MNKQTRWDKRDHTNNSIRKVEEEDETSINKGYPNDMYKKQLNKNYADNDVNIRKKFQNYRKEGNHSFKHHDNLNYKSVHDGMNKEKENIGKNTISFHKQTFKHEIIQNKKQEEQTRNSNETFPKQIKYNNSGFNNYNYSKHPLGSSNFNSQNHQLMNEAQINRFMMPMGPFQPSPVFNGFGYLIPQSFSPNFNQSPYNYSYPQIGYFSPMSPPYPEDNIKIQPKNNILHPQKIEKNDSPILKVSVKLANEEKSIYVQKRDDFLKLAYDFCLENNLNRNLVKPIYQKILLAANSLENMLNAEISKEEIELINEAKKSYLEYNSVTNQDFAYITSLSDDLEENEDFSSNVNKSF